MKLASRISDYKIFRYETHSWVHQASKQDKWFLFFLYKSQMETQNSHHRKEVIKTGTKICKNWV